MDFVGFSEAVSKLLGAHVLNEDGEYTIENDFLHVQHSDDDALFRGADGWPVHIMVGKTGLHADHVADCWESVFVLVKNAYEKSQENFKSYQAYLNSAHETCKTLIKMPVHYEFGVEDLRPCLDVFADNARDIRLFRLCVSSAGYVHVDQPYTDVEDNVDRWFNSSSRRLPTPGTYVVEAFKNVIRDDHVIAGLIQCETAVCKRVDVVIQKTSPNAPDKTVKAYQELMADEHRTFLEFVVW